MRRLFSTFAHGAPGAGLLLMRVAAGTSLVAHAVQAIGAGAETTLAVLHVLSACIGVLLLIGLWTPIVAALAALQAATEVLSSPGDAGFYILLGVLAAALALLGPGGWSVDARLFGWKRIEVRNRNGERRPPD